MTLPVPERRIAPVLRQQSGLLNIGYLMGALQEQLNRIDDETLFSLLPQDHHITFLEICRMWPDQVNENLKAGRKPFHGLELPRTDLTDATLFTKLLRNYDIAEC